MAATRGLASLHHLKSGGGVKSDVHAHVGSFSYPPKKKHWLIVLLDHIDGDVHA
jgi:hypothetical protein